MGRDEILHRVNLFLEVQETETSKELASEIRRPSRAGKQVDLGALEVAGVSNRESAGGRLVGSEASLARRRAAPSGFRETNRFLPAPGRGCLGATNRTQSGLPDLSPQIYSAAIEKCLRCSPDHCTGLDCRSCDRGHVGRFWSTKAGNPHRTTRRPGHTTARPQQAAAKARRHRAAAVRR